jgi:hypothetical protein
MGSNDLFLAPIARRFRKGFGRPDGDALMPGAVGLEFDDAAIEKYRA